MGFPEHGRPPSGCLYLRPIGKSGSKRPLWREVRTLAKTSRRASLGREYALTTGRFREAKFCWPLSGDELKDGSDATRPTANGRTVAVPTAATIVERTYVDFNYDLGFGLCGRSTFWSRAAAGHHLAVVSRAVVVNISAQKIE
jgi:hypothetical protein